MFLFGSGIRDVLGYSFVKQKVKTSIMWRERDNSSVPVCRHANHTIIGTDNTSKSARLVLKEKNLCSVKRWYVATTLGPEDVWQSQDFSKQMWSIEITKSKFLFLKKRYTMLKITQN
jgi:hypothetical protein